MPSGRNCPGLPGFGMNTRRSGRGRYFPAHNRIASSSRKSPTPAATTSSIVIPSTPGAPRLTRTSPQALPSRSLRATLSYRAWKRRS
jgi:hypothetical protein